MLDFILISIMVLLSTMQCSLADDSLNLLGNLKWKINRVALWESKRCGEKMRKLLPIYVNCMKSNLLKYFKCAFPECHSWSLPRRQAEEVVKLKRGGFLQLHPK